MHDSNFIILYQNLENIDYTKFKCEAKNSVGKMEAVVRVQDLRKAKQRLKAAEDDDEDDTFSADYISLDEKEAYYRKNQHMPNKYQNHINKTFMKHTINKSSNKLTKHDLQREIENSLQRVNGMKLS